MRKSSMMCLAMPMMPMMAMARMGWAAWSCGSKGSMMPAQPRTGRESHRHGWACEPEAARPRPRNVVETAREAGSFSSLLGALKAAKLDEALGGDGPFTVFAPNDEAFSKLPAEALQGLLSNPAELAKVLKFHVVSGRLTSAELASVGSLRTLEGRTLSLDVTRGQVGGARLLKADVRCANGVIHVIDSVLLPS